MPFCVFRETAKQNETTRAAILSSVWLLKMRKKIMTLFLGTIFAAALSISASAAAFPDIPDGAWYDDYVYQLVHLGDAFAEGMYAPKIISGYDDGLFHPDDAVTRGEFLKMICEACAAQGNDPAVDPASGQPRTTMRDDIHWAGKYFTMANQHNVLISDAYTGGAMFNCTAEALDVPITRYEAAVILNNGNAADVIFSHDVQGLCHR